MDNNRFGKSLFGFNKNDVYEHIEGLYKNFEEQLREKDQEITHLSRENAALKEQLQKMEDKFKGVEDYKSSIADVLLKAKEQAEEILEQAYGESNQIKIQTNEYIESEKSKLMQFKEEVNTLRIKITELLTRYEKELNEVLDETIENSQEDL